MKEERGKKDRNKEEDRQRKEDTMTLLDEYRFPWPRFLTGCRVLARKEREA